MCSTLGWLTVKLAIGIGLHRHLIHMRCLICKKACSGFVGILEETYVIKENCKVNRFLAFFNIRSFEALHLKFVIFQIKNYENYNVFKHLRESYYINTMLF